MTQYGPEYSGALFWNKKSTSPNAPERTGKVELAATCPHCNREFNMLWWISEWPAQNKNTHQDYLRLVFTFKEYLQELSFKPKGGGGGGQQQPHYQQPPPAQQQPQQQPPQSAPTQYGQQPPAQQQYPPQGNQSF